MQLFRRSQRANNAVRTASPGGELFVASVVAFMILAAFGDAVDPALFGETGLELGLFDLGEETSILAMRHWHLLQILAAGGALAAGSAALGMSAAALARRLRSAPRRAVEKIPIKL